MDTGASRLSRRTVALDTVVKRAKLAPGRNPHWVPVAGARGGLSLGYRRTSEGPGTWIVRLIADKRRFEERIGPADDRGAGSDALGYPQAIAAALAWGQRKVAAIESANEAGGVRAEPTVRQAVESYIEARARRSGRGQADAASRMRVHVLSDHDFAETRLSKLTPEVLSAWVSGLQRKSRPKARRTADKAAAPTRPLAPSTVNRTLNDLRAALNKAAEVHGRKLPADLVRTIKVGTRAMPDATEARRQILGEADVKRIVEAAIAVDDAGDFGRLVAVLAGTGARFSQVAALRVADVQTTARRVMMPAAHKGRANKARPSRAVPVGEDVLALLRPALAGRPGHAPLLERWRHRQTGPVAWERLGRGPWTSASEMTRAWRTVLSVTGLPADIVPYALRHTSIVRQLRHGTPIRIVAAMHDTSVAMIEKHYSAYIMDGSEEIVRAALAPVVPTQPRALRAVVGGAA